MPPLDHNRDSARRERVVEHLLLGELLRHAWLITARDCLFYEQRRWRHQGEESDEAARAQIEAIPEVIWREASARWA